MQAFPPLSGGAAPPQGPGQPTPQQYQQLLLQQQQAQQAAAQAAAQFDQQITNSIVHTSATLSLVEHLDKKLFVMLRDGRKFAGTLRSFDQFANIVLERTVERIFVGNKYAEKNVGIFVIRGENVVLLGEVNVQKEKELTEPGVNGEPAKWIRVEFREIKELDRKEKEVKLEQAKAKRKLFLSRGLSSITSASSASFFDSLGGQIFDDMSTL